MRLPSRVRRRFPPARLPARLFIYVGDDGPDLVFRQIVLPHRHGRIPRRAFARQSRPAFGDAPEDVALRELRDGAVVGERRRRRTEAVREMALAIQPIAVAEDAVLVVDALPL